MGMYDHVKLEEGVSLPAFDADAAPSDVRWQTKTFPHPSLTVYRLTADGAIYKEEADYDVVPEEDRPRYDEELGGFENEWEKGLGMLSKTRTGWEQVEYHGILRFRATVGGERYKYEAKFTDGVLETITRLDTDRP